MTSATHLNLASIDSARSSYYGSTSPRRKTGRGFAYLHIASANHIAPIDGGDHFPSIDRSHYSWPPVLSAASPPASPPSVTVVAFTDLSDPLAVQLPPATVEYVRLECAVMNLPHRQPHEAKRRTIETLRSIQLFWDTGAPRHLHFDAFLSTVHPSFVTSSSDDTDDELGSTPPPLTSESAQSSFEDDSAPISLKRTRSCPELLPRSRTSQTIFEKLAVYLCSNVSRLYTFARDVNDWDGYRCLLQRSIGFAPLESPTELMLRMQEERLRKEFDQKKQQLELMISDYHRRLSGVTKVLWGALETSLVSPPRLSTITRTITGSAPKSILKKTHSTYTLFNSKKKVQWAPPGMLRVVNTPEVTSSEDEDEFSDETSESDDGELLNCSDAADLLDEKLNALPIPLFSGRESSAVPKTVEESSKEVTNPDSDCSQVETLIPLFSGRRKPVGESEEPNRKVALETQEASGPEVAGPSREPVVSEEDGAPMESPILIFSGRRSKIRAAGNDSSEERKSTVVSNVSPPRNTIVVEAPRLEIEFDPEASHPHSMTTPTAVPLFSGRSSQRRGSDSAATPSWPHVGDARTIDFLLSERERPTSVDSDATTVTEMSTSSVSESAASPLAFSSSRREAVRRLSGEFVLRYQSTGRRSSLPEIGSSRSFDMPASTGTLIDSEAPTQVSRVPDNAVVSGNVNAELEEVLAQAASERSFPNERSQADLAGEAPELADEPIIECIACVAAIPTQDVESDVEVTVDSAYGSLDKRPTQSPEEVGDEKGVIVDEPKWPQDIDVIGARPFTPASDRSATPDLVRCEIPLHDVEPLPKQRRGSLAGFLSMHSLASSSDGESENGGDVHRLRKKASGSVGGVISKMRSFSNVPREKLTSLVQKLRSGSSQLKVPLVPNAVRV
ncbi:hypothetical protein BJ742DRAFT_35795 [Cladochytrium replicatum]|nr:hypothetical protein BJ742DRAFT_35795 [Cladochytrium replicatum]